MFSGQISNPMSASPHSHHFIREQGYNQQCIRATHCSEESKIKVGVHPMLSKCLDLTYLAPIKLGSFQN